MTSGGRWSRAAIAAFIAALLYLPGLGRPALWEPDEGRYAEIAREMVVSGDYVTPRDNLVRYFEKPPLVYWAEAVSLHVFGANEFAVRLPAALFTIAEVGVTCVVGEGMFGPVAGFMAAIILALCPLVFVLARFATLDPALAFFLTAAMGAFHFASSAGFEGRAGRAWMLIASGLLALGTLAKGPVALLLAGAIALVWIKVEHRGRDIRRMPIVSCIATYLAIAAPWFVIAAMRNPGFLSFFFVHEHLQRFVSSQEHGWGPWFFVPIVLAGTWPWIFFVRGGLSAWREVDESQRAEVRSALRLLVIWFGVIFIFFSIPRSKLGGYILPALPPIAMVSGVALSRLGAMSTGRPARLLGLFALTNIAVEAVAIVVLFLIREKLGFWLELEGIMIASVVSTGSIVAWLLSLETPRSGAIFAALAVSMILVSWIGERARINAGADTTYRVLASQIRGYDGCVFASYRHFEQSLPFYTGQREVLVEYRGELAPFAQTPDERAGFIGTEARLQQLWASDRCLVMIANRKDLKDLLKILRPTPRIVGCEGKKVALYNRDGAPAPSGCDSIDTNSAAASLWSSQLAALGFKADGR